MRSFSWLVVIALFAPVNAAMATQVSFFEEFPNQITLEKNALIDFDTRVYLAARNLSEFYVYERVFTKNKRVQEVIYWPILEREEGYWISPWADTEALERVFADIQGRKDRRGLEVLLDLEPPLKRSRLFSWRDFSRNKKSIQEFVTDAADYSVTISTVEKSYIPDWLLERLGLAFDPEKQGTRKIKMYYSSYRRAVLPNAFVDRLFERKARHYGEEGIVMGIGLIAPGIHDEQHRLSPDTLQREIEMADDAGVEEIIIFRLGGLDEGYLKILQKLAGNEMDHTGDK